MRGRGVEGSRDRGFDWSRVRVVEGSKGLGV